MRSREFPFEIALTAVLGLAVYLNIGVAERVLVAHPEAEAVSVTPLRTPQPLVDLPPESVPPPPGITPVFYPEGELMAYRNLFTLGESYLTRPAEEARLVEAPVIDPETEGPSGAEVTTEPAILPVHEVVPEIEAAEVPFPEVTLRGIVVSDERQAVVLEIDGSIQIATTQQNLPPGINLVKVEPDSVRLEYQGREYQLTLEE